MASMGDARLQVIQAHGIGLVSKWVDNHIFFCIRQEHIQSYNAAHSNWASKVCENGGGKHKGGWIWYFSKKNAEDKHNKYNEDMACSIVNLSSASSRSKEDSLFTYAVHNINALSKELGIPWKSTKDVFSPLYWVSLRHCMLLSQHAKKTNKRSMSKQLPNGTGLAPTLSKKLKLFEKLLHTCCVVPRG